MVNKPVAIIGSSCRFTGASNTSKLWELLKEPRDVLSKIPEERFLAEGFYHQDGQHHGTSNVLHSYLLDENPLAFDSAFFHIHNREAECIDPQQRLLLENVYETIESACYPMETIRGSDTGVFVGLMCADYYDVQMRDPETLPQYFSTGTARSIVSNRVSYFFDWKGPSLTIDTACSSSLVAVHQAVSALRNGECRSAVAAGVNLIFGPEMFNGEANLKMLSPTGTCKMWDASADGYARGEGCGSVMLKLLEDAIRDGDRIESVIRETGVNSDGRTMGITMPSASSQEKLIKETYRRAGLDPSKESDRCQFFEAHGTGTLAGDRQEAEAISRAFDLYQTSHLMQDNLPLSVGSIKTIVGHLEGCAGIAGLLKASLALQHSFIPPNMHFQELNPEIEPFYQNLKVVTSLQPWPLIPDNTPRRASINSFGFGGTNAHAILESYSAALDTTESQLSLGKEEMTQINTIVPLLLSASSEHSLVELTKKYLDHLKTHPFQNLQDICWTALSCRSLLPVRASFVGESSDSMIAQIKQRLDLLSIDSSATLGVASIGDCHNKILGIFTGQGAQWATMGSGLIRSSPIFRQSIKNLDHVLQSLPDGPEWLLSDEILRVPAETRLNDAQISQPACTAIQIGLVDLLRAMGIKMDVVIGHNSGEIAAAYQSGCLSARDGIIIAYYRGLFARLACGADGCAGLMMAVGIGHAKASNFCSRKQFRGRLFVAASNAPQSSTLSGDCAAVEDAFKTLKEEGVFARILKVDTAYHSPHMNPCAEPYLNAIRKQDIVYTPCMSSCVWISTVHGFEMDISSDPVNDEYWLENLLNPVLFADALQIACADYGPFKAVLEIGPHAALKGPTVQTLKEYSSGKTTPYFGLLSREENDLITFVNAIGSLWTAMPSAVPGFSVELATGTTRKPKLLGNLPNYSWDHRQTFWHESRLSSEYRLRPPPQELLGARIYATAEEYRWRNVIRSTEIASLEGHKFQGSILLPAAAYCAMAIEASKAFWDNQIPRLIHIKDFHIVKGITMDEQSNGIELLFSLNAVTDHKKATHKDNTIISANFKCSSCNIDGARRVETTFHGTIEISIAPDNANALPSRPSTHPLLDPVDMERFYTSLLNVGLSYSGPFKGLLSGNRRLWEAVTTAQQTQSSYVIHPTLLDLCFQSTILAFASPDDGEFDIPYLPRSIKSLMIDPSALGGTAVGIIESFVTSHDLPFEDNPPSIIADMDMYKEGGIQKQLQIEGMKFVAMATEMDQNREMFFQEVWVEDISTGLVASHTIQKDTSLDLECFELCERLSYVYLKAIRQQFNYDDIPKEYTNYFNSLNDSMSLVDDLKQSSFRSEWLNDTHDSLSSLVQMHVDSTDVAAINVVGKMLPGVIRGEFKLSESLGDGFLMRHYGERVKIPFLKDCLATTVKQISHRYPQIRILELGAHSAENAKQILLGLGSSFGSYTYSGLSAASFHAARSTLARWAGKTTFETLDIRSAPHSQGFKDHSYDIIIAPNGLQITQNVHRTLLNVRQLLRPGGYFLTIEITGKTMMNDLMLGATSHWWSEVSDHRYLSLATSLDNWHGLLDATGFSGVRHHIDDFHDSKHRSSSLIVSQVPNTISDGDPNDQIVGRNPGRLLIIGGTSRHISDFGKEILALLSNTPQLAFVDSLSVLDLNALEGVSAVLCMTELDKPLFRNLSPSEFVGLQTLFHSSRKILWVTEGRCNAEDAFSNMTLGLGRTIALEYPELLLQFLDVDNLSLLNPAILAQRLMQLDVSDSSDSHAGDLWSLEPELQVKNGRLLVPRVLPIAEMNDRFRSRSHPTFNTLGNYASKIYIPLQDSSLPSTAFVCVQVIQSSQHPVRIAENVFLYICFGHILEDKSQTVIALSSSNERIIWVKRSWMIHSSDHFNDPQHTLESVIGYLFGCFLAELHPAEHVVIHGDSNILCETVGLRLSYSSWRVHRIMTQKVVSKLPVLLVHDKSPIRVLRSQIPATASLVVDISESRDHITQVLAKLNTVKKCYGWSTFFRTVATSSQLATSVLDLAKPLQVIKKWIEETPSISNLSSIDNMVSNVPTSTKLRVKPIDPSCLLRSDRTYILAGMTGSLGQSLCRWMASNGVCYLVLWSRSPPIDQPWHRELQEKGVRILLESVDVTDSTAVANSVQSLREQWPRIAGIVNGAMVISDSMFFDMSFESFNRAVKPKVNGSAILDTVFYDESLDFFIMLSSLSSVVGNIGQANYSAANMFMASLAKQRRLRGLAACCVDVGMILGVGYVSTNARSTEVSLRRQGFTAISEAQFHQIFAEAILNNAPNSPYSSEIITGLQDRQCKDIVPYAGNPRFSHHFNGSTKTEAVSQTQNLPLKDRLFLINNIKDQEQMLQTSFLDHLQNMLQIPSGTINPDNSLVELGIDSLMAVEIRSWWLKELDHNFPVLKLLGGVSPSSLCGQYVAGISLISSQSTSDGEYLVAHGTTTGSYATSSSTIEEQTSTSASSDEELSTMHSNHNSHRIIKFTLDIPTRDVQLTVPTSDAQSGLLFIMGCTDDSTIYNCTLRYSIVGDIDQNRLNNAFVRTMEQHQSLRTAFRKDKVSGDTIQVIFTTPRLDWAYRTALSEEEALLEFSDMKKRNYDIESGRTMAATLLSFGHDSHQLILGYHHLIMDFVSLRIFFEQVRNYYNNQIPVTTSTQYSEFVIHQTKILSSSTARSDKSYYLQEFADPPSPVPLLPMARSQFRRSLPQYKICASEIAITHRLKLQIREVGSSSKCTPFHFYLASLQVLLARTTGVEDFCIGIGDANRADPKFLDTIGLVMELVPLRFQYGSLDTFSKVMCDTRQKVLAALSHVSTPYHVALSGSQRSTNTSLSPLFQVVLNYVAGGASRMKMGESKFQYIESEEAKHPQDLVFTIREIDGVTHLSLASHEYLYSKEDTKAILELYVDLLETLSSSPGKEISQYPMTTTTDNRALALGLGNSITTRWPSTLSQKVAEITSENPNHLSLKDQLGSQMTYAELEKRVNTIASVLINAGAIGGTLIGVLSSSRTDVVGTVLAIWKIGGIYLPLVVSHGAERLSNVTSNCCPEILVCPDSVNLELAHQLNSRHVVDLTEVHNPQNVFTISDRSSSLQTAVIIYTSGSSGLPKGVVLTHANLMAQITAVQSRMGFGREVVLQQSSIGFDASLFQIFIALTTGGCLILADGRADLAEIPAIMEDESVTMTLAVPTEYTSWLDSNKEALQRCSSWRYAFSGGEMLTPRLLHGLKGLSLTSLEVYNAYGPTECSISCAIHQVPYLEYEDGMEWTLSLVGTVLPGYEVYILDEKLQPTRIGWPGEIFIGGPGVGSGYVNDKEKTNASFFLNPFKQSETTGTTLYRTSDLGRILHDGTISIIGRATGDRQVKLRGMRIELDEISHTILSCSNGIVKEAVVIKKSGTDPFLVSFVVLDPNRMPIDTPGYLRDLSNSLPLPPHMRPAVCVSIEKIPLLASCKVDYGKLQVMPLSQGVRDLKGEELNPIEKKMAEIWRKVLPSTSDEFVIGKSTDLFAIGGNSILLLRIQSEIKERSGIKIPLYKLFQSTMLADMSLQMVMGGNYLLHSSSISWEQELFVEDILQDVQKQDSSIAKPQIVLLTGSTGFLGQAILRLLLSSPQVQFIHCVAVRPGSRSNIPSSPKVIVHDGDLSHPLFGLSHSIITTLANTVDAIIHNGADVSFLKPYSVLRAPNVLATKLLCQIAIPRKIHMHYVSSAGVTRFSGLETYPEVSVAEHPPPEATNSSSNSNQEFDSYSITKWASEVIVERSSRSFKTPATIYRPSSITGENAPKHDLLTNILEYSKILKSVPILDGWTGVFDMISVDILAQMIVSSVLDISSEEIDDEPTTVYRHACGEVRFSAAGNGLLEFVQAQLNDWGPPGRDNVVTRASLKSWVGNARRAGMDTLVAEYLEGINMLESVPMLPILEGSLSNEQHRARYFGQAKVDGA
ncbi:Bcpks3 [Botrytis cinerea B05.10]|uniref:Bcpks3 n=2 Tax=Botryotinia fuckeliana TaxID=40559 RepID=A0A384JC88_BOTFB|nr:Bcpks3 [Botrytis cinerea B05.10]AAR90239.1 polyketide synthase [Botrytis cinerea]ATZ48196.1 Bcpks3 [Botrytis cinerea B05.10]